MIAAPGARRVEAVKRRVAAAAEAAGVTAEITDDGVVLSGRGLVGRTIADPRLRDIAGWGR